MDINNNSSLNLGGFGETHPETEKNEALSSENSNKVKSGFLDLISAVLTFVLTFFLIRSVVVSDFDFSWRTTASYLGIFAVATVYITAKQKQFNLNALPYGLLAIISSFSFALHENHELNTVIFLMIMLLSGVYCIENTKSNVHTLKSYFYLLDIIRCEVLIPIRKIFLPLSCFASAISGKAKRKTPRKKLFAALLGLLLSAPVLLIVVPLLLDSDVMFENLFKVLHDFLCRIENNIIGSLDDWNEYIFMDIILLFPSVISSAYIFSVMFSFSNGVTEKLNKDTGKKYAKLRFVPSSAACVALAVICSVYVIYFFSQVAYFFGAFTGKLPGGIKLSVTEYARQGFFELMKVAIVNFVLVALSMLFIKREKGDPSKAIKYFDVFLCVFTVLLSIISISKILLYISSFGLTEKRLYVFAADIVLIVVFVSVLLRLFKKKFPYFKVVLISVCLVILILGTVGTDNIISKYNANAFMTGKHEAIDADLLYECKSPGFEQLFKIATSDKNSEDIEYKLFEQFHYQCDNFDENGKIQEKALFDLFNGVKNLDEYKKLKLIEKNYKYFSDNKKYKKLFDPEFESVDVFLKTEIAVKSIGVYISDNELCAVEEAGGNALDNDEIYSFNITVNESGSEKQLHIHTMDEKEYIFDFEADYIEITDSESGEIIVN